MKYYAISPYKLEEVNWTKVFYTHFDKWLMGVQSGGKIGT
jgi:hypothetical protein